jgi:hypothetical protein
MAKPLMAKRKQKRRAKNKLQGSPEGTLIRADEEKLPQAPAQVYRAHERTMVRSTLFSADFEAVIEIIAIDRVYRAMLAGLGRRFLMAPQQPLLEPPIAD